MQSKRDSVTAIWLLFTREEMLKLSVPSIASQVDKLHIWVNDTIEVPDEVKLDNVYIYHSKDIIKDDLGANGKVAFSHEWKGYIFLVDDDIVYPKDYVEKSIKFIEEQKRKSVLSYHGRLQEYPATRYRRTKGKSDLYPFKQPLDKLTQVTIIGTGVTFFHSDVLKGKEGIDMNEFPFTNCVDILLSKAFDRRDIKLYVAPHKGDWFKSLNPKICISKNRRNDDAFHCALINSHTWLHTKE